MSNIVYDIDLLIHDFELFGRFTEETKVKVFGPMPKIPAEGTATTAELNLAIEEKASWLAQVKVMEERVKDMCLPKEEVPEEELPEAEKMVCEFEGHDIAPMVHSLVKEKKVNYTTISNVFGPAPRIPDSPDMDAMLDAWEDQAEYAAKVQRAEEKANMLISKAVAELGEGG